MKVLVWESTSKKIQKIWVFGSWHMVRDDIAHDDMICNDLSYNDMSYVKEKIKYNVNC